MRVWNREDWMWRSAAVLGLVFSLGMVLWWKIVSKYLHWPPLGVSRAPGADSQDVVVTVVMWLVIICCWLAILKWHWGAWLWVCYTCVGLLSLCCFAALPRSNTCLSCSGKSRAPPLRSLLNLIL